MVHARGTHLRLVGCGKHSHSRVQPRRRSLPFVCCVNEIGDFVKDARVRMLMARLSKMAQQTERLHEELKSSQSRSVQGPGLYVRLPNAGCPPDTMVDCQLCLQNCLHLSFCIFELTHILLVRFVGRMRSNVFFLIYHNGIH